MPVSVAVDAIAAFRAGAPRQASRPAPGRLWGSLADAWLRHLEPRAERDGQVPGRPGVPADFESVADA